MDLAGIAANKVRLWERGTSDPQSEPFAGQARCCLFLWKYLCRICPSSRPYFDCRPWGRAL